MKALRSWLKGGRFLLCFLAILTFGGRVFAQTDGNLIPVVTVQATQPVATATNSGVFTVFRKGNTNLTLNVWYDLDGTASNGVDYVALSGFATIPTGERRALITVIPIDDGPPDFNKTVILTLTASTNTPPDYLLGFPLRAGAVIIDSDGPRPVTGMLPGHCFHFSKTGPDATWFSIEYSTNLVNWTPVCTNQVIDGSIDFIGPDAAGNSSRFYRAVPLATSPAD